MATKSKPKKIVLITGANGFIGSNLIAQLQLDDSIEIRKAVRDNVADTAALCKDVDFVFHIAGENRPADTEDFAKTNVGYTEKLLEALSEQKHPAPLVFASTVHADLDTPYGVSKKEAEVRVFAYGKSNKVPVYVFRLTNVFGKWARPNYNSVVATFCYNLVHDKPLQINDPDHQLNLVHIDDVVRSFIGCFEAPKQSDKTYCETGNEHQITLGTLAETLQGFWESRQSKVLPDLSNKFNKALYGTLTSYYDIDKLAVRPELFADDRGWLFELVKSERDGQIFVSSTHPGYTRGDHWHHTKVEKFTVIKGSGKLFFRRLNSDEIITYELSDKQIEIVDIPTGYVHAIQNDSEDDMLLLIWASEILDKSNPDTYYEHVKR